MRVRSLLLTPLLLALLILSVPESGAQQQAQMAPVRAPGSLLAADALAAVPREPVAVHAAEGTIEPSHYVTLGFQVHGRVAEVLVGVGDAVDAGQPLVRLDDDEATLAWQQAQAQLASATAGVEVARAQLLVEQARIASAQEQVQIAQARLELETADPLPEMIDVAEAGTAAATANVNYAVASRNAYLETASGGEVRAAEANLAAASANRCAAQAAYDAIFAACYVGQDGVEVCPLFGPEEEKARARLEAATALESAAKTYLNDLLAGPTGDDRAVAEAAVSLAVANREITVAEYGVYMLGASPAEVAQAELNLDVTRMEVAAAEARVQEAAAALSQSEAEAAAAQVLVDKAAWARDQLTRTASFAGSIVEVAVQAGELVVPGQPVIGLADLSSWLVHTDDLTELDILDVSLGMPMQLRLDALPGVTLNGQVVHIALIPELQDREVVYEVVVEIDDIAGTSLYWGMTALVEWPVP